jgi:hypothetical protein
LGSLIDDQKGGLAARVSLGLAERNRALNRDPCKRRKFEIPQENFGGSGGTPWFPSQPKRIGHETESSQLRR